MATVEIAQGTGVFTLTLTLWELRAAAREATRREEGTTVLDVLERVVGGQLNTFRVQQGDRRAARLEASYAALSTEDKALVDEKMPGVDDV